MVKFTDNERKAYDLISSIAHRCSVIESPLLRLSVRLLLERAGTHLPFAINSLRVLSKLLTGSKIGGDKVLLKEIAADANNCITHIASISETTAKITKLIEILKENSKPAIVFCHNSVTINSICGALASANITYVPFHGSIPAPKRTEAIESFRNGDVRVLVSTESGGEGHNLQFCNTLINFDLPWNPMAIEQRIGRIHRIGQQSDVYIFNLCHSDTLEEEILKILETKIRMFELVIGEVDSILGNLDEQGGFSEVVFDLWTKNNDEQSRKLAFEELGDQLINSRSSYIEICKLDEELFGTEMES
jgi:SNF2 family DNA or RNA helicase